MLSLTLARSHTGLHSRRCGPRNSTACHDHARCSTNSLVAIDCSRCEWHRDRKVCRYCLPLFIGECTNVLAVFILMTEFRLNPMLQRSSPSRLRMAPLKSALRVNTWMATPSLTSRSWDLRPRLPPQQWLLMARVSAMGSTTPRARLSSLAT